MAQGAYECRHYIDAARCAPRDARQPRALRAARYARCAYASAQHAPQCVAPYVIRREGRHALKDARYAADLRGECCS